ncbi:MAG: transposase [Gemmatimonadota bacterium]
MEFFAWRQFRNRREVGSLAGLTPTPFQSGDSKHELGISKSGNRLVRMMAVEIAGAGSAGSRRANSRSGTRPGSVTAAAACAGSESSHWRANS